MRQKADTVWVASNRDNLLNNLFYSKVMQPKIVKKNWKKIGLNFLFCHDTDILEIMEIWAFFLKLLGSCYIYQILCFK